ncbi:putative tRNA (cytidine(34)-2'-O)-methyltransferase [Deinococcus aerolatus]|uniref:Putative tRNA (cytidine(34)-2'-O)-methyltransferase n=1 Tax=Deinococcus aerolatus TaxID=522487 RepID=A0ABQ2GEU0_9DEIO|nr:tRNA (cytidine(34)-2'-O)-methyltransferase [Deinococcus aerolatus]GGL92937.1 putative tRNA (cytidine(34)-2'-O)-methyltransferase [Deinococcus aerolatus]
MREPLLHVVLFEPEKAGNVGNVARTCAVLGATLHLIRPFGFHLHDREFRRAVMDYLEGVTLHEHVNWTAFQAALPPGARVFAFSTHATTLHTRAGFRRGDYLLFGPESRGLPVWLREGLSALKLPQPGAGRSLNLAVAAGAAAFEAGRQIEGW